eukprot:m.137022 g.137022  ORF g.137022 m.137022 type:complete len:396 (-) comp15883_c3_seq1:169-1356(-)
MMARRKRKTPFWCCFFCLLLLLLCQQYVGVNPIDSADRQCPHHTYAVAVGADIHCVCPDEYFCEGCVYGCHAILKERCIRGFRPACDTCRCEQGASDLISSPANMLGHLVDRRNQPFCELDIEKHARYAGNHTFVFVVSNGHTGTTFLGQQMNWRKVFGTIPPGYVIAHEEEASRDVVRALPFDRGYCQRALDYVINEKLPIMERALATRHAHTYFATGHQIILGLLPALVDVLGNHVKFVRLRRDRMDTAFSFAQRGGGPCSRTCRYCLCPLDDLTRCPVSAKQWNQLNEFQQYLWAVDEVECQWQALLRSRPGVEYMELNWTIAITAKDMVRLAEFLQMSHIHSHVTKTEGSNPHVSPSAAASKPYDQLAAWTLEYSKMLHLPECNSFTCISP